MDVVALVFCLPRRSPARRRKLKIEEIHWFLRCDLLVRPLRAHGAKQGKRKNNDENSSPKTQEKTHAADTPKITPKTQFWEPKCLPNSTPGPFVSLLAPGFAQDRPQDASKSALGSLRGAKKTLDAAKAAPKKLSQPCFAVHKTDPPGGGAN